MYKIIIIFITTVFMAGVFLTSCDSSAKKVEDAREDLQTANDEVSDAQLDLFQAKQDSSDDYQEYKKESEARIKEYDKSIAELKMKIANEKKYSRTEYQKLVAGLEQKNAELKKSLNEYKEDGQDKWQSFKTKFNSDMDGLGKSISNFFSEENKK